MIGSVPFMLILLVIASLLRVDLFFSIVYLFFLAYVLSRLWVRWMCKGLRVERRFVDHAFFGDEVTVRLDVHNATWLPVPWLALHESLPVQLAAPSGYRRVLGLGPRGRREFQYTLHCRQRVSWKSAVSYPWPSRRIRETVTSGYCQAGGMR